MRFIETKRLSDFASANAGFFDGPLCETLPSRLEALERVSLQEVSLTADRSFLEEIGRVLNVIASIIYHPHISNKREEVIVRIEQAQQLSREDFYDTARDSKLWKEHDLQMIPEEVYYHQHIDELRIYENRFIGFLIDRIDRELTHYGNFYLLRLPTLSSRTPALDASAVGALIVTIDRLRRKTQFIKNSFFYREVSRGKPISHRIHPTNILVKDRLYRYCFRFYRTLSFYEDRGAAERDLCTYYTVLLFEELTREGFVLSKAEKEGFLFERADFSLLLSTVPAEAALEMTVTPRGFSTTPARHRLEFLSESEETPYPPTALDGRELLSPWELRRADQGHSVCTMSAPETEMIRAWLQSKIRIETADPAVYTRYCPVCGHRGVEHKEDRLTCPACTSSYVFDQTGKGGTVWFRKIRKKELS